MRNKAMMSILTIIKNSSRSSSQCHKSKQRQGKQIGKWEKLSLYVDGTIGYKENPRNQLHILRTNK